MKRHTGKMKIFVIYDADGRVWDCAHKSFESAINVVKLYLDQANQTAYNDGFFKDHDERPAKLETDFNYKDEHGGLLVAHNELEKISTYVKELSMY